MRRPRLSYANVVATLALVVALGTGGAWAATQISGGLLQNRSVPGKKLKKNTVTGKEVKEARLARVPQARNALTVGGVALSGLTQGGGTLLSGHDTATAGGPPGPSDVIRSISTPTGLFRFSCGSADADIRYVNTTPGSAEVVRTVGEVEGDPTFDDADETDRDLVTEPSGNDFGVGYAATNGTGPKWIELRVGKGSQARVLQTFVSRSGLDCSWTWTLVGST